MKGLLGRLHVALICAITPRCRNMTRLISADREEPISWLMRLRMRWHYGICVWCVRYRNQIGLLGRLSQTLDHEISDEGETRLSDESKAKIKETIARKTHD